jgi:geranylgeranylglycerol-phosphate geranylgeranyltransferase
LKNAPASVFSAAGLIALIRLSRPHNGLITAASVGVGALVADASDWTAVAWAALSAALVAGAGNVFNDVCDLEIDRINRPDRPLPVGLVSRAVARAWALLLTLAGIGAGAAVSTAAATIAAAVVLVLAVYSLYLKRTPLWGNICVAAVAAIAFPYGALAAGHWGRVWIPTAFAFLYHLGRELIKDLEDIEGDRRLGARTAPLSWGVLPAAYLAGATFILLAALTLVPTALGLYGLPYLLPVLVVDAELLQALIYLKRHRAQMPVGVLSRRLLLGMLAGLAAIIAGETL